MFQNCPALVLNADFQPLSYFPLSLFGWEDAIKAVVKGSHVVVAEYDQVVRSPSTAMHYANMCDRRPGLPSHGSTCSCATTSCASIAPSSTARTISPSIMFCRAPPEA